jgi:hypothetical protein
LNAQPASGGRWRRLRRLLVLGLAPAAAAACAVLMLMQRPAGVPVHGPSGDDLRVKGGGMNAGARRPGGEPVRATGPALEVYVRRTDADRVERVAEGGCLDPGDRLRFLLRPVRGRPADHLLLVSLDGAGALTVYYPYGETESGRLAEGARVELPGSIELDGTPGPERLFAIVSRAPVKLAEVRPRLEALFARGPEAVRAATAAVLATPDAGGATDALDGQTLSFLFEKSAGPRGCTRVAAPAVSP